MICTSKSKQRDRVERAAQSILDARAQFPHATLADLYRQYTDPLTRIAEKETRKAKRRASQK